MRLRAASLALAALAVGLAACGDDGTKKPAATGAVTTPTTATSPQATAPSAPEPPPDATNPGGPEHTAREKDNGGEEPVRVDAAFTLRNSRLRPASVTTPSFLAVTLSVRNLDAVRHVIVVKADRSYGLAVGAGRHAVREIPGQRAGTYPILVDGRRRGALTFGGEPGP